MRTVPWPAAEVALAAAETWGISGTGFLQLYVPVAIFAVGVAFWLRHRVVHAPASALAVDLSAPELGLLTSDERAVMASVALLRSHELIDAQGCSTGSRAPAGLDLFTVAVSGHLGKSPQSITEVTRRMRTDLDRLRAGLVDRGYMTGPQFSKELREAGLPIVVVGLFGVVRLIAGLSNSNPVFFLGVVLVLLGVAWWRVVTVRRVTGRGKAAKQEALIGNFHLRPSAIPSYPSFGPAAAGLAVALFGVQALMLIDPGLNTAMSGYSAEPAGSGGEGGSGGDGGGGGGDGGGCGGGGCGGGCGG